MSTKLQIYWIFAILKRRKSKERFLQMITIGICDDDQQFTDNLYSILHDIMLPISDWKARIFHSGAEVLAAISNEDFDCNLLFTDIFMENGNDLELAKYIYEHNIDTDIIFITNSKDHVYECFQYHTFAYLLKPLTTSDIGKEVRRYMEELSVNVKCLNLSIRGSNHKIPINSILYIESNRRKITIHTKRRDYDYYEKLDILEQLLHKDGFVRCHQSYLVQKDLITSYNINNTISISGLEQDIPVSRKHQKEIRQLFEAATPDSLVPELATTQETPSCYITNSLQQNQPSTGAFICTKGAYIGAIIRIKPEQSIRIGRDNTVADMIVNLPLVSRLHCEITYHADKHEYEIVDYSSNGTFVNGYKRLLPKETYILKPGTELCFGDKETIYKLG